MYLFIMYLFFLLFSFTSFTILKELYHSFLMHALVFLYCICYFFVFVPFLYVVFVLHLFSYYQLVNQLWSTLNYINLYDINYINKVWLIDWLIDWQSSPNHLTHPLKLNNKSFSIRKKTFSVLVQSNVGCWLSITFNEKTFRLLVYMVSGLAAQKLNYLLYIMKLITAT